MMNTRGPWLGQVPLVLGPSSWAAGMARPPALTTPEGTPPYYGDWGIPDAEGFIVDGGRVGPFDTIEEAFSAAVEAAGEAGAKALPLDGFAQVVDSRGRSVGPIT